MNKKTSTVFLATVLVVVGTFDAIPCYYIMEDFVKSSEALL